ncbi:MAG TPA: hypothetical protein VIF57_00960 [Polyangia bacterium]|jgi:hypothetical protein
MATQRTRKVTLRKGRKQIEIALGKGHVWEIHDGGSMGHPLYNAREELALFDKLLRARRREGYRLIDDTGLVTKAGPKKPAGMNARTWRWVQDADQILQMFRDDDYDNHKDIILDARSTLKSPPAGQAARVEKLEKMLATATRELRELAAADPAVADYAKGLIEPLRKKTVARERRRPGRSAV